MKRMSCVFVAIAILACSTQVVGQKGTAVRSPGYELKARVAEAFTKSKRIRIRVKDAKDLRGTQTRDGSVSGLVKSVTDTCFMLQYNDGSNHLQSDCIPYGDAILVTWQAKTLHILKVVGEYSALTVFGVTVMPIVVLVLVAAAVVGHPIGGS